MNKRARLIEKRPLPPYAFIPGRNIHPNKPGGHMYEQCEVVAPPIRRDFPEESEEFCYAIDLFNYAYYWESHVYLEAIWNAHQRKGAEADLMKALIKLGAAGVKFELGQFAAGIGHLERALELVAQVKADVMKDVFLGLELSTLLLLIEEFQTRVQREQKSSPLFSINPIWS